MSHAMQRMCEPRRSAAGASWGRAPHRSESCSGLRPSRNHRGWWPALVVLGAGVLGACSLDGLLKSNELPPNVTDPAITQTPAGARAAYNGTIAGWQQAFGRADKSAFVMTTGLLSDELEGTDGYGVPDPVSARRLEESPTNHLPASEQLFTNLNNVRQRARQANGLASDFLPEEPALRAHLYAVEGYAEVMLAEFFCSGIPLSTVDYKGDYTLRPGSTTAEVFTHAAALFDTALAMAGDSTHILNLSRVGRARALLGLGDYAAAAAAAAQVPDTFAYTLRFAGTDSSQGVGLYDDGGGSGTWHNSGVADREGANGLAYRSSGDPRVGDSLLSSGFYHPQKYHLSGIDTLVIASGIEARLIEAEAALQAGDVAAWLAQLNGLRETAITPALPDTTDPGSDTARVSLLFRERAFWLFLTGHRQGDMRRLVRQYGRLESQVYPIGAGFYGVTFGPYVDAPIPWDERALNPLFTGCIARD